VSASPVIRLAQAAELPLLQRIEREAGSRFRGLGLMDHLLDHTLSLGELSQHQRAGRIWAVDPDDRPIGFAVANVLDGAAHLESSTSPDAGRRGVGPARQTVAPGQQTRLPHRAVHFRDIPWNGRLPASASRARSRRVSLRAAVWTREAPGIDDRRVMMARPLT
jgi:hypothetical protein